MSATSSDILNKNYYIFDSSSNYVRDNTIPVDSTSYLNPVTYTGSPNHPIFTSVSPNSSSFIGNTNATYPLFLRQGPYNLFDLQTQISNRSNILINALIQLSNCDKLTKFVNTTTVVPYNQNNPLLQQKITDDNLKTAGCNLFNNVTTFTGSLTTQNANIISNGLSVSIFQPGIYSGSNINTYPDVSSNYTVHDIVASKYGGPKGIPSQICDITNLTNNLSTIIQWITDSNDPSILENTLCNLSDIKKTEDENVALRNDLDNKVKEILQSNDSYFGESKQNLDTAIYTNIMWTILATSILYFVFAKM